MLGNSPKVISNQPGCHDQLTKIVLKHLNSEFKKPYADFNLNAFAKAQSFLAKHPGKADKVIFDSGCGVGESTAILAELYPDHLVFGIDQSAHRTSKHHAYQSESDNYLVLRAELGDFWRLALDNNWRLAKHFILYPNPWPKRYHVQKRWHGSALFPYLIKLGGQLELRSNWKTYLDEFAIALNCANLRSSIQEHQLNELQTPHERKYLQSGHLLWRLDCELRSNLA